MKFIIDAHLPSQLASCFQGCDVLHTSELKEGNNTSDQEINKISIQEKYILITKDSDFYYSYLASGKPHKLVHVKLGNMKLKDLISYFYKNAATIITLLEHHSYLILEKTRIRVLD